MLNKKAEEFHGFKTVAMWILIIAVGILLLVIMAKSTGFGKSVIEKIMDAFPFV